MLKALNDTISIYFRITYSEAIDILNRSSQKFTFPTDVSGDGFIFSLIEEA